MRRWRNSGASSNLICSALERMLAEARYDLIVMGDSDARVGPDLLATFATEERSASPFSKGGVPTQMKMASVSVTALSAVSNCSLPAAQLRCTISSRCGSKNGSWPFCKRASFC